MSKFRKKPVIIDAIQISKNNLDDVRDFMGGEAHRNIDFAINYGAGWVSITTLEGRMVANPGDWIIKGVKGEFYPCKPDIFEATYEEVKP